MTGKSTLLKITSVLLIVFGAMAVLMSGIALAGMNVLNQWALAMGGASLPLGVYIFSLLASALELAAGIMGLAWKSRGVLMGIGMAVVIVAFISLIVNTVVDGFQVMNLLSLILPVLYVAGAVKSE